MTSKDNGRPAFPQKLLYRDSQGMDYEVQETGMTLRDWFAGQVLASCARYWIVEAEASDSEVAKWAYETADAMIEERSK